MDDVFADSYCGQPPTPLDVAMRWNLDPWMIAILGVAAGIALLRRDALRTAGVAVLALLFISPLCALANALFSVRTAHHLLLMLVAAPLLAAMWRQSPRSAELRPGVAVAFGVSTGLLWAWHIPALYALAVEHAPVYLTMQATLLASAWAYWRAISCAAPGVALGGLFAGAMQMGLLGALLTLAQRPLYSPHALSTEAWGMTALADQQLAGLLMWVPAMLPYAVAGLFVIVRTRQVAPADPAAAA